MPAGLKLIRLLKAGCWLVSTKKPKAASMADEDGVAEKVAVKPLAGDTGKLMR